MLGDVRLRPLVLLTAAAIAVAACASTDPGVTAVRSRAADSARPADPEIEVPEGGFALDPDKPPQDYDGYLLAAIKDIAAFWAESYPAISGTEYVDLQGGIHPVYPGKTGVPGCGTDETAFEDVEGNAFYCSLGDFMAYDDTTLFPQLDRNIGRAVIAVVLAHEWGHAIQGTGRLEVIGTIPTVVTELQADCFAGAWAAHATGSADEQLAFDDADVRAGLIGMITVADVPGSSETDPNAHGSAFDRVGAFEDGFKNSVDQCATYLDTPPDPLQFTFSEAELTDPTRRNPSDAAFDDLVEFIPQDLERFWTLAFEGAEVTFTPPTTTFFPTDGPFPACSGVSEDSYPRNVFFCKSTNVVLVDQDLALELYEMIGDFTLGYLVGNAWSDAVQVALGTGLAGEERALMNDCLTGAWTGDLIPDPARQADGTQEVTISAGDLDEAVVVAVRVGDDGANDNVIGSAFEKIDAFRAGVLGGLDACAER
jgi:predicted metalloprotease